MNAALRLSWYKFKHHYMDFVKVLLGIIAFEGLILYIQDKGFLKDFETTRMTLFLLLFSTSLLIVVQNSIYISKERSVLNRDFFSGLSRSAFAIASMGIHAFFAVLETIVFILSYSIFSKYFDRFLKIFILPWIDWGPIDLRLVRKDLFDLGNGRRVKTSGDIYRS